MFIGFIRMILPNARIIHVRRDAMEALKKDGKAGGVTEDQVEVAENGAQRHPRLDPVLDGVRLHDHDGRAVRARHPAVFLIQ